MTRKTVDVAKVVSDFMTAARNDGFQVSLSGVCVVRITKDFQAGSNAAYTDADMGAYMVMEMLPSRDGSMWGTTSDGIGGALAVGRGVYTLNKSGIPKRIMTALAKVV